MAAPTPRPPQGPAPRRPLGDGDPGLGRSATDSGRMGDKAGAFDPAAAHPGFARSKQPRAGARSASVGLRTSLIALVVLVVIGLLAGILLT
ncbi:hypothetical protein ACM64Y_07905 [Novispirillum sp. DQ9]|uniref:hypothetical protein n=1 Tax=Novispirillum sp. DQ9 TaxID=3398612 RepID=UPI003C7EA6EC